MKVPRVAIRFFLPLSGGNGSRETSDMEIVLFCVSHSWLSSCDRMCWFEVSVDKDEHVTIIAVVKNQKNPFLAFIFIKN